MTALDRNWLRAHPMPQPGDGGKSDRGAVLIVGGGLDLVGALLLAGVAALRAGAGKLQLAAAAEAAVPLVIAAPEARVIPMPAPVESGAELPPELAERARRCDALLVGPGTVDDGARLAARLLDMPGQQPIVLDAGALQALDMGAPRAPGHPLVLTPHAGEMARLLDRDISTVEDDAPGAAVQAARAFDAVVAFKGASTVLASPDGACLRYAGGGPGLGTSGSGDVLAGLTAGLLARGAAPLTAAAWAVYLHGEAGVRLASRIGPLGFLAREVADEVPGLMAALT
jgi:ADP-dependent NAD(P)H-hydrate dehydratase